MTISAFCLALVFLTLLSLPGPGWAQDMEREQTPKPPFPYRIEEVKVATPDSQVSQAGTLTLPEGGGPFPAVLLLTVAGPNDRDQSFLGHKGFWVLADYLTRHGIVVLRLDDRGVRGSSGQWLGATYQDLAQDALAAVDLLRHRAEVTQEAVGLIGNSEGGAIAALAASQSKHVAFIVMLAGPGLKGTATLRLQLERAIQMQHIPQEQAARYRELFQEFLKLEQREPSEVTTRAAMTQFLTGGGKALFPPYGFIPSDIEGLTDYLLSPWHRSQLSYDPSVALKQVHVPVLALSGEKDRVLPPDEHLAAIDHALHQAGNADITVRRLPELNHLFQTAVTGSPLEYGRLSESFSPYALEVVADWLLKRFTHKHPKQKAPDGSIPGRKVQRQ